MAKNRCQKLFYYNFALEIVQLFESLVRSGIGQKRAGSDQIRSIKTARSYAYTVEGSRFKSRRLQNHVHDL